MLNRLRPDYVWCTPGGCSNAGRSGDTIPPQVLQWVARRRKRLQKKFRAWPAPISFV